MTTHQPPNADLLDALLAGAVPDSPAALTPSATASPAPAVAAGPLTVAYVPGQDGALVPVYVPVPLASNAAPQGTAVAPHSPVQAGPLVPRWAVGTAVVSVGVGGGAWLLAGALNLASAAVAGLAAGAAAALPLLVVAGVAVAALAGRRSKGATGSGSLAITQTITQTITNAVQIGD
ncbi:hypothetical protein ACH4E7_43760 [Kitasatospora sp. NPDC018058]|uniref:hypothetical protein n=1 Tax=Kitasatospora sp. NPDC018058 TaxID=3364025 RepID=UPI0037BE4A7E